MSTRTWSSPASRLGRRGLLTVYAILIAVPLVVVVATSFKSTPQLYADPLGLPKPPTPANFRTLLTDSRIGRSFLNSVVVTAFSVTITLAVSSWASFAISRIRGWLGIALFTLFAAGLAVPAQVAMIPQYVIFRQLGLTDSLLGLVIINIAVTCPVAIFIMTGFFATLPHELFEAARIDGASTWRIYRSIALPLALPSVAAVSIFLVVMHWNDLLYPLLFITSPDQETLPKTLLDFRGEYTTNFTLLFAGVLIASAPMVVAYVALQRYFIAGLTAGATKG